MTMRTDVQHFQCKIEDGIATVRLDRPDRKNPLTFESYAELRDWFRDLVYADDVNAVVFASNGGNFSSGGDVHDIIGPLTKMSMKELLSFTRMTGDLVKAIVNCGKPVIAAVDGICVGAGAIIAMASDLRIASPDAKCAFLFTRVGLTGADMGAAHLLPKVIGTGRASELLMLGDKVDATECYRIGLANRVVAPEELQAAALEWATRLANGPTLATAMTKRLLVNKSNKDLDSAIEQEAQAQALLLRAEDHREFYEAWREKRKPEFKGR